MDKRQGSVEVTPRMIKAGLSVLLNMGNEHYGIDYEEIAKDVYLEMIAAKEDQTMNESSK